MKTKTMFILLIAMVVAIAVNSFVIVSNHSVGSELLKSGIQSFSSGADLNQGAGGPTGPKVRKEYNCRGNSVDVQITETRENGRLVKVGANLSGGINVQKVIQLNASSGWNADFNNNNVTTTIKNAHFTLEDSFFGQACNCLSEIECVPWDPCPYYLANRSSEYLAQEYGLDFANFGSVKVIE